MIQDRSLSSIRTKIVQIACGLVLFVAGWIVLSSLMKQSYGRAGAIFFGLVALATVLLLDDRYWLLLPILSFSGLSVPGLPFTGVELGCLIVTTVHAVRLVLRRDSQQVGSFRVFVTVPLLLWIAIVFMLNPVGMAMLGSQTIGGRFYFDIAIGFSTFLSLASLHIGEKDARFLFYAILVSQLFVVSKGVVFPQADPDALVFSDTGLEREVSSRYAFVGCSVLFMLLFAKWSIRDVLRSPIRMTVLFLLTLLTVYSGKRQAFGTIFLVPIFRMLLKRRDAVLTCALGGLAAVVLGFAVAGDGSLFTLPQSAKRALAVVAPRYARETAGGIHDLFRQEMRTQAYALIAERPLFGRKGFAMDLADTRWMNFGGGYSGMYVMHAYSGNWHNMWLAYACDFGLPGLLLALLFWLWILRYVFRENRMVVFGTYLPACFLFYSFVLLTSLSFSWVSGHASLSTYMTWIQYGMLLALSNGCRASLSAGNEMSQSSVYFTDARRRLLPADIPPLEGMA